MEVLHERCAGLDVHKKSVVACVLRSGPGGTVVRETRTFGTMLDELEQLRDWLRIQGCSHAAMEATGVYWKPVYNVLEGHLELLVAQRPAHQGGARAQDGRQGCRVDRHLAAPWPAASQFHPRTATSASCGN